VTEWVLSQLTEYDPAHIQEVRAVTARDPALYGRRTLRAYAHAPTGLPPRPVDKGTISSEHEGGLANATSMRLMTDLSVAGLAGNELVRLVLGHNMVTRLAHKLHRCGRYGAILSRHY
jgi:hypothetical protein